MDKLTNETERSFRRVMEREGKTATIWGTNDKIRVFFRRFSDNRQKRNTVTIYYDKSAEIAQGSIFQINGANFIVINRETPENEVYRRSTCLQCNGFLTTKSGTVRGIPFYSGLLDDSTGTEYNQFTTVVDGKMELITNTELAENITLDDKFNAFGRTWKITNFIYVENLLLVSCEMTAAAPDDPDSGGSGSGSDQGQTNPPETEGYSITLADEDLYYVIPNEIGYSVTLDGEAVTTAGLEITFSNVSNNARYSASYDDSTIYVTCTNDDKVMNNGTVDITVSISGTETSVTKTYHAYII